MLYSAIFNTVYPIKLLAHFTYTGKLKKKKPNKSKQTEKEKETHHISQMHSCLKKIALSSSTQQNLMCNHSTLEDIPEKRKNAHHRKHTLRKFKYFPVFAND